MTAQHTRRVGLTDDAEAMLDRASKCSSIDRVSVSVAPVAAQSVL